MQRRDTGGRNESTDKSAIKKVLVIKGPGIGDAVTAVPLMRNFKERLGCEVHLLEEFPPEKHGKIIVRNCPYIDKVMKLDYNIWYLRPRSGHFLRELATLRFVPDFFRFLRDIIKLRRQKYDMVFEGFPGTKNTHALTRLIAPKWKACCASHPLSRMYDIALDIRGKNIVELENGIFGNLGIDTSKDDLSLEMFVDKEQAAKTAEKILQEHGIEKKDTVIGITTGLGYTRWHNTKLAQLIDCMSGGKIILLGDAGQRTDAEEVKKLSKKEVTNLCGKLKLEETIAVISGMRLFICTNGGLMWIAAALGLPTVVVSGPTPYWWDPHTKNTAVVRKAGKAFYEQEDYSWLQHARAEDVTVEDVVAAIKELGDNNGKK